MLNELARELKRDLVSGTSRSAIIEKFRPRARPAPPRDTSFVRDRLPCMFAGMAIHRLGHQPNDELITWAESFDAPPQLNLRRA